MAKNSIFHKVNGEQSKNVSFYLQSRAPTGFPGFPHLEDTSCMLIVEYHSSWCGKRIQENQRQGFFHSFIKVKIIHICSLALFQRNSIF